jgi:glycosyltransferase involved in cell wall biosynthesis
VANLPRRAARRILRRQHGATGTTPAAVRAYTPGKGPWLDDVRARFWRRVSPSLAWQRLEPRLLDYERAYRPVIEELRPDLLHAHDYRMIGVGVRAAERLRSRGADVRVLYDSHEFLPGVGGPSLRWEIAHQTYEADHIRRCDAVVAVSDEMAARIRDHHHLPVTPTVVMNAPPMASGAGGGGSGDVRTNLGLADDVPILVYLGVSAAKRGLATAVRGLPRLPGAHLALVTTRNAYVDGLEKLAAELGVADRLHVLPYVPVDDVVPFVATASAGLQSMVHVENYDVTIATKFFDYAQARLPIVQSDVRAMAALVRSIGCGEVFVAEDVDSFTAATARVLADPGRYRAAYERPGLLEAWTWEAQAGVLAELYRRLRATPVGTPVEPVPTVGR